MDEPITDPETGSTRRDKLLTLGQAAKWTKQPVKVLKQRIAEGALQPTRVFNTTYLSPADIRMWLAQCPHDRKKRGPDVDDLAQFLRERERDTLAQRLDELTRRIDQATQ